LLLQLRETIGLRRICVTSVWKVRVRIVVAGRKLFGPVGRIKLAKRDEIFTANDVYTMQRVQQLRNRVDRDFF
jgi:hypothetical protein